MKYLCIAYYDPSVYSKLTKEQLAAFEAECKQHEPAFKSAGTILVHGSLGEPQAAAVIRPENGKQRVGEGPYLRTQEQAGAFFIVEARDLNDAVRIASRHPGAIVGPPFLKGGIEVRACGFYEAR